MQFAVGNHFVERPVGRHRGQAAELQETSVPQLQHALGVDHRHALGEVVHRTLQQVGFLRDGLLAAHGLTEFDVGDVGEQDHPATFLGRPFADLQPATVLQAIQHMLIILAAIFFAEQSIGGHQPLDLAQPHPGHDAHPAVGPECLETAVEQDDALLCVEQHERIGNALDGVDQVPMGRFRPQPRLTK